MDNNLHNDNDGLEDFFRDRLFNFQDEPGDHLWEKLVTQIPEKPKRNYKPLWVWSGRAVAACLIFSLGFFNYQYKSQMDSVAQKLLNSQKDLAQLEQRLNEFSFNQVPQVQETSSTTLAENHINTSPKQHIQTLYYPQTVYLPAPQKSLTPTVVHTGNTTEGTAQPLEHPNVIETTPMDAKNANISHQDIPMMAFASNQFNQVRKEDILDLNQEIPKKRNRVDINKKNIKMHGSKFVMKKGRWAVGNQKNMIRQFTSSQIASRQNNFGDEETESVMTWANNSSGMHQANKAVNWNKVLGVGANYSINSNLSVFMGPDYLEGLNQHRTLSSTSFYPYMVGLESGVTYHF